MLGFAEAIIEIETTPDIALPQDSQEPEYQEDTFEQPISEAVSEDVQHLAAEDSAATDEEPPLTIDETSRYNYL